MVESERVVALSADVRRLLDEADQLGIDDGLRYEYDTHFPIADTTERLASFR